MDGIEKVGRLKPDEDRDVVRVIVDGPGDILVIPRSVMAMMVRDAGDEQMMEIRVEETVYLAFTWQVKNMLAKWPWKKAGVFVMVS